MAPGSSTRVSFHDLPGYQPVDVPDHYFDDFEEDLTDPKCVQEIYDFSLNQIRGMVDYNDEDDVIQEVFYRLTKWPITANYNSKRHYFSLLKITIRQAIAAYWKRWHSQRNDRRKRRYVSEFENDLGKTYEFVGKSENVLHHLHLKEVAKRVFDKVTTLTPKQKTMFRLRFMEEKSHEDIAHQLGISIRTSYRLESQVRGLLQDSLGDSSIISD